MEFKNQDFADFWTTIKEYVDYVFKVVNNKIKDIKIFNSSDNIESGILISDSNNLDTGNIVYGASIDGGASSIAYNTKYAGLVPEFKHSQEKDNATAILTSDGWVNSELGIKLNNPIVDTGITLYTTSGTSINLNKSAHHYYATDGTIQNISSLQYIKFNNSNVFSGQSITTDLQISQILCTGWWFDGDEDYQLTIEHDSYIEFVFYNNSNDGIALHINSKNKVTGFNIPLPNETMGKLLICNYSGNINYKFIIEGS